MNDEKKVYEINFSPEDVYDVAKNERPGNISIDLSDEVKGFQFRCISGKLVIRLNMADIKVKDKLADESIIHRRTEKINKVLEDKGYVEGFNESKDVDANFSINLERMVPSEPIKCIDLHFLGFNGTTSIEDMKKEDAIALIKEVFGIAEHIINSVSTKEKSEKPFKLDVNVGNCNISNM